MNIAIETANKMAVSYVFKAIRVSRDLGLESETVFENLRMNVKNPVIIRL